MALYQTGFLYTNTIGECVARALQVLWNGYGSSYHASPPFTSITVEDFMGCPAVHFVSDYGVYSTDCYVIALEEDFGTVESARVVLETPGVATALADHTLNGGAGDRSAEFLDYFIPQKQLILSALVSGLVTAPVIDGPSISKAFCRTWLAYYLIKDGPQTLVVADSYRLYDLITVGAGIDAGIEFALNLPAHQQSPVPPMNIRDLVEAVDAITDQDFEISFNNGAFVFSVKAKILVG